MKVARSAGRSPAMRRTTATRLCTSTTAESASRPVYWLWFRYRPRAPLARHHAPSPSDATMTATASGVHTPASLVHAPEHPGWAYRGGDRSALGVGELEEGPDASGRLQDIGSEVLGQWAQ